MKQPIRVVFCLAIPALKCGPVVGARVNERDHKEFQEAAIHMATETLQAPLADDEVFNEEDGWSIDLPLEQVGELVSSGIGPRSRKKEDYILRSRFGRFGAYRKRSAALPAEKVSLWVLTKEQYVKEERRYLDADEALSLEELVDVTHVIVSVTITAGPIADRHIQSPLDFVSGLGRLVSNPRTKRTMHQIAQEAWRITQYERDFCPVADEIEDEEEDDGEEDSPRRHLH